MLWRRPGKDLGNKSSEDERYTEETSVEKKFPKYREGSTCFCDVWAPGSSCLYCFHTARAPQLCFCCKLNAS